MMLSTPSMRKTVVEIHDLDMGLVLLSSYSRKLQFHVAVLALMNGRLRLHLCSCRFIKIFYISLNAHIACDDSYKMTIG